METLIERRRKSPANVIRVLAVVLAVLLVSFMTLQRSQSAFTAKTTYDSPGGLKAATLDLGAAPQASFDVANLVPGDYQERCVDITYGGTAASGQVDAVRVYGTDNAAVADGGNVARYLGVSTQLGNAGTTCADPAGGWTALASQGTLNDITTNRSTYDTAFDRTWTPATTGEKRAFKFRVTMLDNAPDAVQGKTASPTFTWEIRSLPGKERS